MTDPSYPPVVPELLDTRIRDIVRDTVENRLGDLETYANDVLKATVTSNE